MKKQEDLVLCASYNSSKTVVAFGMSVGFRVYSLIKFTEMLRVDIEGGVGLIDMFEYSNLFALRSASSKNYEDKNKVILYDGKSRSIVSIISFEMSIRSIRITNKYLLACGITRSFIYSFSPKGIEIVLEVPAKVNPEGACDLNVYKKSTYLAVPMGIPDFEEKGIVAIHNMESEIDPYILRAFDKQLDYLRFDKEISRIVAYNHEEKQIRIFEIRTGRILQSLERDYQAPITSIEFSCNNLFLVVCDRHADVEIYNTYGTDKTDKKQLNVNRTSLFSFLSNLIPKFKNEWSFAKKRSIESCPGVCFFTTDSQFCIVSFNGQHMKYSFDILYGGDCFLEEKVCDFIL
jgi:hypothetical protein